MLFSAVLVPFFTKWAGISLFQMQLLQSWFMLWIFVLEVPTGAVADKVGRKYSLALGSFVTMCAALLYGSSKLYSVFLIAEFMFACGMSLLSGADEALLYDALKEEGKEEEAAKILGRAHTFRLFGMLLAAPLGGLVASKFGYSGPMYFSAIPQFFAIFVALSMGEPKIHTGVSESKRYLQIVKEGIYYLLHHKALRRLTVDALLITSATYFVIWYYQPILSKLGVPIFWFGFFHLFLVGFEMVVAAQFSRLVRIVGSPENYMKWSAILAGVGFMGVVFFPHIVTVVLFLALSGGFGLTRIQFMSAHMNKHIKSENRATVLSSISMFRRFVLVILNPFMGILADKSIVVAMFLVGLLPFVTLFIRKNPNN